MEWTTACPDWESRIVAGKSLVPVEPLFPEEADASLAVFRSLRIADIAGKPCAGEVCRSWLTDFVGAIFGAYDPHAERQMIREFLLAVAKKNGKSTIASGIMMTALIRNPRNSASFIILAPTKEIAGNSFEPAADMADSINKEMEAAGGSPLFRVYRRERRILHLGTRAELKIIAADSDTVGGTKATAVLVDELWLFGKKPGAMSMFREAMGGLAARPEGFVIYLTTMSDDAPAGEFKAKLDYARQVRDGKIVDPAFLPVIYEFPAEMLKAEAHRDPANWYVTNPNLGASVDERFIEREFRKAADAGEHALRDFEAKHLNVPISQLTRSDGWSGALFWAGQADTSIASLDAMLSRCDVATVGIDGGGLDDLLGVAVLGREKDTRDWLLWNHAFAAPIAIERRKSEASRYRDFKDSGDLTIVDALPDDISAAVDIVRRVYDAGLLGGVGLDQIGLGAIVDALAEIDVTQENKLVFGISQGYRLANAIKTTERKLADGTLRHGGTSLMAWCAGNAKVEPRGNAIMITKAVAGLGKIDPLVATFNAAELMSRNPEAQGGTLPSDYELPVWSFGGSPHEAEATDA